MPEREELERPISRTAAVAFGFRARGLVRVHGHALLRTGPRGRRNAPRGDPGPEVAMIMAVSTSLGRARRLDGYGEVDAHGADFGVGEEVPSDPTPPCDRQCLGGGGKSWTGPTSRASGREGPRFGRAWGPVPPIPTMAKGEWRRHSGGSSDSAVACPFGPREVGRKGSRSPISPGASALVPTVPE